MFILYLTFLPICSSIMMNTECSEAGTILDCSKEDGFGVYDYTPENKLIERLIFLRLNGTVDVRNLPSLSLVQVHEGQAECKQLVLWDSPATAERSNNCMCVIITSVIIIIIILIIIIIKCFKRQRRTRSLPVTTSFERQSRSSEENVHFELRSEFRAMYQSEKLLNAVEHFLGPEIAANPVWNTRPKTPGHQETHVPWHQDAAYFDHDGYQTLIVTAWIALVDVTEENGAMQFCKGGHKKGLVGVHTCSDNFYLTMDEKEMINRLGANPEKDFVTCPVKAGGVVFFSSIIPHRSIPNLSNHIRWAMDLRYQSPHRPWGFYGMKQGILLRSPDQPDLQPDWDFYDGQDRYDIQKEYEIKKLGHGEIDEFDTIITGPQFDMWKIAGHNRHIDQFLDEKAKQTADKK